MIPYTKSITIPAPSQKLIDAKQELVNKLRDSLAKEQAINRVLGGNVNQVNVNNRRVPEKLARFVRNVDVSYKHHVNQEILQNLLIEAQRDLLRLQRMVPERRRRVFKTLNTLNIIYRAGIIRPPSYPAARDLKKYHWEYCSKFQPWDRIGEYGQIEIRPNVSEGKVRLHYDEANDHLISNVIDIGTVIKRQSASAKRQPYRFGRRDPEFIARCKGVAGRILRLTEPRIRTTTMFNMDDARFSIRVFQDRVARLPEHLNMDVADIIDLCQRGTTNDDPYIKMIEFCEPTIHLNPAGLRRELKEIGSGLRVVLKLGESEPESDSETKQQSGGESETESETNSGGESETESETNSGGESDFADETDTEDEIDKLTLTQLREQGIRLRKWAEEGGIDYGVNGNSNSEAIKAALRQEQEDEQAEQKERLRKQQEEERKQQEELRKQQEELRKQQEEERKQQEELRKQQEEERLRKQQEELRKQQEELRKQQEEERKQQEELRKQQEEERKQQEELRKQQEEERLRKQQEEERLRKQQEELRKQQEEERLRKQQEEERKQQEELRKQQEELRKQQEEERKQQEEADRLQADALAALSDSDEEINDNDEEINYSDSDNSDFATPSSAAAAASQTPVTSLSIEEINNLNRDELRQIGMELRELAENGGTDYGVNGNTRSEDIRAVLQQIRNQEQTSAAATSAAAPALPEAESSDEELEPNLKYNQWQQKTAGQFTVENYGTAAKARKAKSDAWKAYQARDSSRAAVSDTPEASAAAPALPEAKSELEPNLEYNQWQKKTAGQFTKKRYKTKANANAARRRAWEAYKAQQQSAAQYDRWGGMLGGSRKHHVPAGELTEMLANMTDDWASSEDELNFAAESEAEEMQFAESSAAEHNDSGALEFAESSAIETDSDNDFATTSTAEKTSSGLEFAESSAVDSDSAKEHGSSSGLGWAESSDYD